ncbi:hypothetical protein LZC95_19800 [Pendulispora brunnea]|uniref:ParB/Sulfiredoxin domain-containing protein n=1 Tax=Pendulispora brunnea TaxID=2905690 RepID=A0ABZ2KNY7_9BACT
MTAAQFQLLVDNVRRDGGLTSLPLVHGDEILSGNHRVAAAEKAGLEEIDVLEVLGPLDEARRTAIQLSHNAIVGQDDLSILVQQYKSLDFDNKLYSGLNDDVLKQFDDLKVASLATGQTAYQDIVLTFLPEDAAQFLAMLERLGKHAKKNTVLVNALSSFDAVFDAVVRVKKDLNIVNTALAVRAMAELALERLGQLEKQHQQEQPEGAAHESESQGDGGRGSP